MLSAWTEERTQELTILWGNGASVVDIAAQLQCSRNAIIGKAHRLDLPPHPTYKRTDHSRQSSRPERPRVEIGTMSRTSPLSCNSPRSCVASRSTMANTVVSQPTASDRRTVRDIIASPMFDPCLPSAMRSKIDVDDRSSSQSIKSARRQLGW